MATANQLSRTQAFPPPPPPPKKKKAQTSFCFCLIFMFFNPSGGDFSLFTC